MTGVTIKNVDYETGGFLVETPVGELELQVLLGQDGTPILYIDTPDIDDGPVGPPIRIWLNDETVWEGVPVPSCFENA